MDQKLEVHVMDVSIVTTLTQNEDGETRLWSWVKGPALFCNNCQIGYFRINLSLCIQALLWKTLIRSTADEHVSIFGRVVNRMLPSTELALILLWSLSLFTLVATCLIYTFKCMFHFDKVKEEFLHHVGVNYFFAPWISSLLLLQASPPFTGATPINSTHNLPFWWVLIVIPIIMLDIKIYGQWLTKGKRFLSRVANPASQLTVIANLVAARASMEMGWKEGGLCLFSMGMAHYLVLFVTLYQRLPGGDGFPMNLRPVFFLFIGTPSMASLAWRSINGSFDSAAKMLFFLSLFLFLSLVCRPSLFKKSMKKFSVSWWSYSFSLTLLALAAFEYAEEVKATAAHAVMLLLSQISMLVLFVVLLFTVMNTNKLFGSDLDEGRTSS